MAKSQRRLPKQFLLDLLEFSTGKGKDTLWGDYSSVGALVAHYKHLNEIGGRKARDLTMPVSWPAAGHYKVSVKGGGKLYLMNRFTGAEAEVLAVGLLGAAPLRAEDFTISKNFSEMQATLARSGNFVTLPCITVLPVAQGPLQLMPPPTLAAIQDQVGHGLLRPPALALVGGTPPRATEVFETPPPKRRCAGSPDRSVAAEATALGSPADVAESATTPHPPACELGHTPASPGASSSSSPPVEGCAPVIQAVATTAVADEEAGADAEESFMVS